MQKKMLMILALLITGLLSSCAHDLEVRNMSSYRNMAINPLDKKVTIGVVSSCGDAYSERLIKGVGSALGKYNATVLMPYNRGSERPVDIIATVSVHPQYEGSGWNFLINWPGFLIFTPAWHGYVYKANYDVAISLTKAANNAKIDSWNIPIELNLRHAEMDRTWTEISWFEWSVIAFVGGIVFTRYDTDVTPILMDRIEGPIGDYIAQDIINRINNSGQVAFIRRWDRFPVAMLPNGR